MEMLDNNNYVDQEGEFGQKKAPLSQGFKTLRDNVKIDVKPAGNKKPRPMLKKQNTLQKIVVKEVEFSKPAQHTRQSDLPAYTNYTDLACDVIGGRVIFATDDWFAPCENMIQADNAVFKPDLFTEYGKWMDGWETRRKRIPGNDWCIIQLGCRGKIRGVEVSTHHFTGNYPPRFAIRGASLHEKLTPRISERMGTHAPDEELHKIEKLRSEEWEELVSISELKAGYKDTHRNFFEVKCDEKITHVRLDIYPDGGVARLRVHGEVTPDWSIVSEKEILDLAAMVNGGICLDYSDAHYGRACNVIAPGKTRKMDEGWETARRLDRPPILTEEILPNHGGEWALYRLGHPGCVEKVEIDTNHFKGNYPHSFKLEDGHDETTLATDNELRYAKWKTMIPYESLKGHEQHIYTLSDVVQEVGVVNYVRLTIAPDGGVSRMLLFGHIVKNLPDQQILNGQA